MKNYYYSTQLCPYHSILCLGFEKLSDESSVAKSLEPVEEWVNETQLVPQQIWEEEPVERIEYRTVMEERQVPQVKSLYPFSGQGMVMVKGEVTSVLLIHLFLLTYKCLRNT